MNSIISLIKQSILYFVLFVLFQGCNTSSQQEYRRGFSDGYKEGIATASKQQSPVNTTSDENYPKADYKNRTTKIDISDNTETTSPDDNTSIPKKVYDVLSYIEKNKEAPDGYVGGRIFSNYEKVLPQTSASGNKIEYREWDVNPKVQGVNRGTQRLVTGDDGRAWYTNNHYKTFTQVKQ